MSHRDSAVARAVAQAYERGAAAADVQRRLAGVRGTGAGDGGLVTAVVSGTGELLDLRISQEAMRLGPAGLGAAIVAAAGFATDDARQRGYTLLALALGDEAAAEVERHDGPTPARALGWDTVTTGLDRDTAPPPDAGDSPVPGLYAGPDSRPGTDPAGRPGGREAGRETGADRPDGGFGASGGTTGVPDEDDVFTFDPSIFRSDR